MANIVLVKNLTAEKTIKELFKAGLCSNAQLLPMVKDGVLGFAPTKGFAAFLKRCEEWRMHGESKTSVDCDVSLDNVEYRHVEMAV